MYKQISPPFTICSYKLEVCHVVSIHVPWSMSTRWRKVSVLLTSSLGSSNLLDSEHTLKEIFPVMLYKVRADRAHRHLQKRAEQKSSWYHSRKLTLQPKQSKEICTNTSRQPYTAPSWCQSNRMQNILWGNTNLFPKNIPIVTFRVNCNVTIIFYFLLYFKLKRWKKI